MRRTISWSVWVMRRPEGSSPLRAASPLRCSGGAPLGCGGWCMAATAGCGCGGDSLRVRLRGGRWPAPSSPESVEARLAREPRRPRRKLSAPAASAEPERPSPSDVTTLHHRSAYRTISLCSRLSRCSRFHSSTLPSESCATCSRNTRPRSLPNGSFRALLSKAASSTRTQKSAENDTTAVFLRNVQHRPSFRFGWRSCVVRKKSCRNEWPQNKIIKNDRVMEIEQQQVDDALGICIDSFQLWNNGKSNETNPSSLFTHIMFCVLRSTFHNNIP